MFRPNLEQEMNNIISLTVQADKELTLEEQIKMAEELFQELLEEGQLTHNQFTVFINVIWEIESDEKLKFSRAQEEAEWMETVPVPCPNCDHAEMIFETNNSRWVCSSIFNRK